MEILVIGGTKFFGIPMVNALLEKNHSVTIATRGLALDPFGNRVKRIIFDRHNIESIQQAFANQSYDIVIDKIAYASNDVDSILSVIKCKKYILMSSTAVYDLHIDTKESDYIPDNQELIYCNRNDMSYGKTKQQAEIITKQKYRIIPSVFVRYPYVIGKNDYTKRLLFYIEHIVKQIPMYIDNIENQMSFISEEDAGKLIANLADTNFTGPINGASKDTISLQEIIDLVEKKTGLKAILDKNGNPAPYNGTKEYSINTMIANQLGYTFIPLKPYIEELIDCYLQNL